MELPYTFRSPLPAGVRVDPVRVVADDGAESWALHYAPAGPPARACVALAHPRVAFSRHYLIPGLLAAGHAVFGHDLRGNEVEALHERLLLDVAAGLRAVRARHERVVLLGNSGGGTLFACYQAQARRPPAERARATPGGGRVDLTGDLPAGDALVVLAAHPGEGRFLLQTIDPSVVDEADPLAVDPALDMMDPANGYDPTSGTARYGAEFLARYRAAQRARIARLDEIACAHIAAERAARASRRALPQRLMVIYRTTANPAYVDLSIDPSDRDLGTIFGLHPAVGNFHAAGVARVLAPRAWLSTWSALSSRADFLAAAPALDVPVLFMPAAGDSDILPADADAMWAAIGAADRTRHDLRGADHYLRPTRRHAGRPPREEALAALAAWIAARF